MGRERTYSNDELVAAVAVSNSWRGVLRELGLAASNAAEIRSVRGHADRIGIDHGHIGGNRQWREGDLRTAVAKSRTWRDVAEHLALRDARSVAIAKGQAVRLGLDVSHIASHAPTRNELRTSPHLTHLNRAGSLLAAAWFAFCGQNVSWPLEPCRYDLLVDADEGVRRIQVKTTTTRAGYTWKVYLSTTGRERRTYDPNEIDEFFVIDGDLDYYLIPIDVVAGLQAIHVGAYKKYRLAQEPE